MSEWIDVQATAWRDTICCTGPGKVHERLDDEGNDKLAGLLEASDPQGGLWICV